MNTASLNTTEIQELKTPGRKSYRRRLFPIVAFVIVCMIGVALISWFMLIKGSIQLDEAQTLWQTDHSIGGTLHVVALDVHVPMYHLLIHFWQLFIGQSVSSIRIFSLIIFLITIPIFYLLSREILSVKWSLFALALFSFSPFMEWYANVARMYTLLGLFAVLSQLLFIRLMRRKKGWLAYGLSAIVGGYTHYFFSFNLATEGFFILFGRKNFKKGSLKRIIIVGILVAIALAPWLYYFHSLGSASGTRPNLARPTTVDFFNAYSQFLFGFQDNHINTILVSMWPILMLFGFLALKRNQRVTPEVSFIATMAFVPVIAAFILSFIVSPFFLSRYLISAVAPLVIFIVWLVSHYQKYLAAFVCILLVGLTIFSTIEQAYNSGNPNKEDYRDAVSYINTHAEPQDAVIISTPFTIYPVEYYYNSDAAITTLPIWSRYSTNGIPAFSKAALPSQVTSITENHKDAYLLLSYNQGYENTIKQYFLDHYTKLYSHTYSNDLTLYEFKVGYNTVPAIGSPTTQLTIAQITP